MCDQASLPQAVGSNSQSESFLRPLDSCPSASDLSEATSDMSLSTSPGSDIPQSGTGPRVLGMSTSPISEASSQEPPKPYPRKRLVVRQLSSNPYLASSEMSPSDDHPVIMGANSFAGGEASSYLNSLFSGGDTESRGREISRQDLFHMRASSFPLTSDLIINSEDEVENENEDVNEEEESDVENSEEEEEERSGHSEQEGRQKNSNQPVNKISEDSSNNFHPVYSIKQQFPLDSLASCTKPMMPNIGPSPTSVKASSGTVTQSQQHTGHPINPQHHPHHHHQQHQRNENMNNHSCSRRCGTPSSKSSSKMDIQRNQNEQYRLTSRPEEQPIISHSHNDSTWRRKEESRHGSKSSGQPQSREINSWGHFSKPTESHYKYRRSHYSSDSDEEEASQCISRLSCRHHHVTSRKSHLVASGLRHSPSNSPYLAKGSSALSHSQSKTDKKSLKNSGNIRPQVFKDRMQVMKRWFGECNDAQKNIVLKGLLDLCELPQLHLLSVHMSKELHHGCPSNCEDILTWLPTDLATKVMSYLDPVSLCRAAQVCCVWRQLAEDQSLWRRFCCQTKWRLSKAAEHKQVISHMCPEGSIQWKNVFAERFRLRNNWLSGRCTVRTFEGHLQGISCVQFDDSRIVSGSSDKTIKVWNMRTNAPWSVQTLMGHHATVRCLHLDGNRLVSGSCDTTIKVWDLSTQESWSSIACKVTMTGHSDTVRCLQADDDKVISGSYDKTLKIWDLKSGELRRTLRGHQASVLCVHFSETKIVSGSADKTIKLWNYEGQCMNTLRGHLNAVTCLMFDSTRIVSGSLDHNLKFWDVHSGDCLNTIDWKKAEGHTDVVRCLQADSWRVVSAADDKTIKVWNLATGERLVTLRNHTDGVTCLQFNDFIIVSGSYDKSVKLWDFSCC